MKTWYFAECKKCMEAKYIFVNNPTTTAAYLSEHDIEIYRWLQKHDQCELTLGWRDDHLDALWPQGYINSDLRFENDK